MKTTMKKIPIRKNINNPKKKHNKKLNKKLCMILATAIVMTLLTGCQQTPDKPVVIEKNQEQMLDAAENGGENSSSLSSFEIPERFTGDWTSADGRTAVHADAEIQLPDMQEIPIGTVNRRDFTQEDADRLLSVFIGDNTFYQEQGFTKQDAMRVIEMYQEVLRGERPVSDAGEFVTIEDIPGYMEEMTEMLKTLPDESERFPASRTFEPHDFYDEVIEGYAEVDGRTMHVHIDNFRGYADRAVCYMENYAGGGGTNGSYAIPYTWLKDVPQESISEQEAREAGEELIDSIGFTNVVCDKSTQVAFIENYYSQPEGSAPDIIDTGYELEFVRCVNGVPVGYTNPYLQGSAVADNEVYVGAWHYERITVDVTKKGIVYFCWTSPYTEPVVTTQDAQLLGFDDIQDIFRKMVFIKYSYFTEPQNGMRSTVNFDVDEVRLSLMRIRSNGNISEGLIVPVWDFWGTSTYYPDENSEGYEEYTVLLTVNAIDGTIIDRQIGY